jgi:hypothetical protein
VFKNQLKLFQIKKTQLDQSFDIEPNLNCKSTRRNKDSSLKKLKQNIPRTSILLNFDENFRIKMPPVPVLKPKGGYPSLTPFQKIELRRSDDKELLRKRVTMNTLQFFRKEAYAPEELKRKILLKRNNYDCSENILFSNSSNKTSKTIKTIKTNKMTAPPLPILDFHKALSLSNNNAELIKYHNPTDRYKMQTISDFINKEINLNVPIPQSTINKKNNIFSKTQVNLQRNYSSASNLLSINPVEKTTFKLNYKMITLN